MKKYTIEIEIEETIKGSGFLDTLRAEVEQEQIELGIAVSINKASNKVHRRILADKIEELNEELSELGVSFGEIKNAAKNTNEYREFYSEIKFNESKYYLTYLPSLSTKNEITRYSIFSDNAEFRISRNYDSYPSAWTSVEEKNILEYMRDSIKSEIKKQYKNKYYEKN
tara:strand:- start:19 stop:525 length:507 start_codon:yes stop_codon:yes gene_type:complete